MPSSVLSVIACKVADLDAAVRRSAALMRRVHTDVLPRSRRCLEVSDTRLNDSTGQELASAQRLGESAATVARRGRQA